MSRGFEIVEQPHIKYVEKVSVRGVEKLFYPDMVLPVRSDAKSAGYDLHIPIDVTILPGETKLVFTNIKAYMEDDEVLEVHIRSSVGFKQGVILANSTGIIDSSYYGNKDNDGNIGLPLKNTTGQAKKFKAGDRLGQAIFKKYLITDDDNANGERSGGFGSSGK